MKKNENKSTKIVYVDNDNIETYESLEPNDFKEFFMKYFKYRYGDEVKKEDFSNPILFALFKQYKRKIDENEEKWMTKAKTSAENGKKGGRPKKQEALTQEEPVIPIKDYVYYPKDKRINEMIINSIGTIDTGETRYAIIEELKKDGNSFDESVKIYDDIISKLNNNQ